MSDRQPAAIADWRERIDKALMYVFAGGQSLGDAFDAGEITYDDLEQARDEIDRLSAQVLSPESAYMKAHKRAEQAEAKYADLATKNRTMRADYARTIDERDEEQDRSSRLGNRVQELARERDEARAELAEETLAVEVLADENEVLRKTTSEARAEVKELQWKHKSTSPTEEHQKMYMDLEFERDDLRAEVERLQSGSFVGAFNACIVERDEALDAASRLRAEVARLLSDPDIKAIADSLDE